MANTNRVFIVISASGETKMIPDPGQRKQLATWQEAVGGYVHAYFMNKDIVVLSSCTATVLGALFPRNLRMPCFYGNLVLVECKLLRSGREIYQGFRPSRAKELIAHMDQVRAERIRKT